MFRKPYRTHLNFWWRWAVLFSAGVFYAEVFHAGWWSLLGAAVFGVATGVAVRPVIPPR